MNHFYIMYNVLMKGKEEGGTRISEGWQGSFEGIPEGKARGNS